MTNEEYKCERCNGTGRIFKCSNWPGCHCPAGSIKQDCPGVSVPCGTCRPDTGEFYDQTMERPNALSNVPMAERLDSEHPTMAGIYGATLRLCSLMDKWNIENSQSVAGEKCGEKFIELGKASQAFALISDARSILYDLVKASPAHRLAADERSFQILDQLNNERD